MYETRRAYSSWKTAWFTVNDKYSLYDILKNYTEAGHWWLIPVIPATQEEEIRRITVRSHSRQIVQKPLSQKNSSQKRAVGVAQDVSPEVQIPVPHIN
jgi:hypothetical protein